MWLRIKLPRMELALVDADQIVGWEIEVDDGGVYALTAITPSSTIQFTAGTQHECHAALNYILSELKIIPIDIN